MKASKKAQSILKFLKDNGFFQTLPFVVLLYVVFRVFSGSAQPRNYYSNWPPMTMGKAAQILIQEAAVHKGDSFRGRVAVLFDMNNPKFSFWGPFSDIVSKYEQLLGYHLLVDFMGDDVPI